MAELIKRPEAQVSRAAVQAAMQRLREQPTEMRQRLAMRVVDEYAATLHTSRVYAHAEKVVAEAFIEAARANEDGKKIFICECLCEKSTYKKFLIATFSEKEPAKWIMDDAADVDHGTKPATMGDTEVGTMCDIAPITCDIAQVADIAEPEDDVKTCTRCEQVLPLGSFTRNRSRPDGHASACRTCEQQRKAASRHDGQEAA